MSFLTTTPTYDSVYQLESTDDVQGGAGGISNRQAQQLGDRDDYLLSLLGSISFDKVNDLDITFGGTLYSPVATETGTLFLTSGLFSGVQVSDASGMPDGTTFAFFLHPTPFSYLRIFPHTLSGQFHETEWGISDEFHLFDGGVAIKKFPGDNFWTVIARWQGGGTGAVILAPAATPPSSGWLLCNGAVIPSIYDQLIARIGATAPTITSSVGGFAWFIHG